MGTNVTKDLKNAEKMSLEDLISLKNQYERKLSSIPLVIRSDGENRHFSHDISREALANIERTDLKNIIFRLDDLIIGKMC